jgi:hypothetical protein
MKTSAIFSFVLFGMTALSAPLTQSKRTQSMAYSNVTTTTTTYEGGRHILPEAQIQFNQDSPDTPTPKSPYGVISSKQGAHQMRVAYNFQVGAEHQGKQCRLAFRVTSDGNSHVSQSYEGQSSFQIWRLQSCVNDGYTYNAHPAETTLLGVVNPKIGAYAGDKPSPWTYTPYITNDAAVPPIQGSAYSGFPCLPEGTATEYAFELLPTGMDADVRWKTTEYNLNGLVIETFDA